MFKGMVEEYKKNPSPKLFNQIVGLKFKNLRLDKNITAEAVVEDNKIYFNSIYDLYKFEKGIKTDCSKTYALSKYFKFSFVKYFNFLKL